MSYNRRHLQSVSWVHRNFDFFALPLIVLKIFAVSAGYLNTASFGSGIDLWAWFGLVLLGIIPYLLVFGFLKYFLRMEVMRMETIVLHDEFNPGAINDTSTYKGLSVSAMISDMMKWTRLIRLAYFAVVMFYVGIRFFYAAELSGLNSIFVVDAFMVISLVMVLFLEHRQKQNMLLA